jgi:hypothetical protein
MAKQFRSPDFTEAEIEIRFEDGEICIYGTPAGLRRIAGLCNSLADRGDNGHIHLDRDHFPGHVLTDASEVGAIAVFEKE